MRYSSRRSRQSLSKIGIFFPKMRLVGVEKMHGILTDELNKPPKGVSAIFSADVIGNRYFEVQRVLLYIYLQGIGVEKMHGILMDELNKPPKRV